MTLAPLPLIHVTIHAPKNAGEITVGVRDADEPFGSTIEAVKQNDGSLTIALQHAGRYWLVTRTTLCPSAAHLGKVDVNQQSFEITPGMQEALDVSFTDRCGEIDGVVTDKDGKPALKSRNLILLTGTPDDPGILVSPTPRTARFFMRVCSREGICCGHGMKATNGTEQLRI